MEVGTVNVCRVPVPVSGASDMQLEVPYIIFSGTGFRRRFLVRVSLALVIIHSFIHSFIYPSIHPFIHSDL